MGTISQQNKYFPFVISGKLHVPQVVGSELGARPQVPQHPRAGDCPRTSHTCHKDWFSSFPGSFRLVQQNLGSSR